MCGTFPDPSDSGQCLPERDSGHGLRISAYDGRSSGTSGKRRSGPLGLLEEKLCRRLYGKSGSLDTGRRSAAGHVFSDYEKTEPVSGKVKNTELSQLSESFFSFRKKCGKI